MKIAIQTLMLYNNYGGILQAFALQHFLQNKGVDVVHLKRYNVAQSLQLQIKLKLHNLLYYKQAKTHEKVNDVFAPFISKYINYSPSLKSKKDWQQYIARSNFDAVVVGSDQVWRYEYIHHLYPEFFLDFTKNNCKKISYSASFGVKDLRNFPIESVSKMLQDFDAISVREDNGVDLIETNFGLTAEHHVDPTILFNSSEYITLFNLDKENVKNEVFCYVLDKDAFKKEVIDRTKNSLNLEAQIVYGASVTKENYKDKDLLNKPPIEGWLQNFLSSKFIVTDSFHGMLFSIIFNKPFIVIANEKRGVARFTSFLKKVNLLDRLIYANKDWDYNLIQKPIDFASINQVLLEEQKISANYFKQHLGI